MFVISSFTHSFIWACYPSSQSTDPTLITQWHSLCVLFIPMPLNFCLCVDIFLHLYFASHHFWPYLRGFFSLKASQGPNCIILYWYLFKKTQSLTYSRYFWLCHHQVMCWLGKTSCFNKQTSKHHGSDINNRCLFLIMDSPNQVIKEKQAWREGLWTFNLPWLRWSVASTTFHWWELVMWLHLYLSG